MNEKKKKEEVVKKTRNPVIVLGIVKNDDNTLEEIDFMGKHLAKKCIEEDCKGDFSKDGWIKLKEGGKIKFIVKPQYLVMKIVKNYKECNIESL